MRRARSDVARFTRKMNDETFIFPHHMSFTSSSSVKRYSHNKSAANDRQQNCEQLDQKLQNVDST